MKQSEKGVAVKITGLVLGCHEHLETFPQIVYRLRRVEAGELDFCFWFVFERFEVQGKNFGFPFCGFGLFIESLPCFVAKPFVLFELVDDFGQLKHLTALVIYQSCVKVIRNFH